MRVSTSAAFYALFLATAEAGPLRANGQPAPNLERRQGAIGGSLETVVTVVPTDAFGGASSIPAVVASSASEVKPSEAPGTPTVGRPLPTKITTLPTSTATVDSETYKSNQDKARQLNEQFSTLTPETPCTADEVACIDGGVASCSPVGNFNIAPCPADTRCFALPMAVAVGVRLECVTPESAKTLLEDVLSPPAASSSSSSPSNPPAASSSLSGGFTRTATITRASGSATVTLTFDPNASASLPAIIVGPSSSSLPGDGAPFPVVPIPSTTTIFTTVFPTPSDQPANTPEKSELPPVLTSSEQAPVPTKAPEEEVPPVISEEPTRTRTRTRSRGRPQPAPTSSIEEPDLVDVEPTGRPESGNGGSGPNEDTRVTFTRVETVTVTEKETVTVTAGGAEAAQTGK